MNGMELMKLKKKRERDYKKNALNTVNMRLAAINCNQTTHQSVWNLRSFSWANEPILLNGDFEANPKFLVKIQN